MSLERIDKIFNFEKGILQSSKCTPGDFNFITASSDWKTHNEYSHDCEALIFAAAASGSLGRTHYVNGKFISSDLCFIITPKDQVNYPIDLKFYHILFNELKEDIVKNTKAGTSKEAIGLGSFGRFELPYFEIETQKQIRELFGKLEVNHDDLSNKLTHQLSLVKQLRQAFLREAMQGKLVPQNPADEPASELLRKIKAEKEQLIKEKKLKKEKPLPPIKPEEIPFEIPEGWVWCRLGDLRDIRYSLSYGVLVPGNDVPNGIPFIRVQDLDFADQNEIPRKHISPSIDKQYSKTRLVGGEILICVVGSIGKVALSSNSWIGSNIARAVCRYMPNQNISRRFLFYCLTSPYVQNFFQEGKKSVNPTLNVNVLETTLVPIPPYSEQLRIVQKLEQLMQLCNGLEQSITQSQQQNEMLLQQVLREALEPKADLVE